MPRQHSRVLNLSDKNDIDFTFLEKGLNFIPAISRCTQFYDNNLRMLLSSIENRSERKYSDINFIDKFKQLSKCININLNSKFIESNLITLNHSVKQYCIDNLSSSERNSLDNLKKNENVIIKSADKGSMIVILNRKDYLKECLRQLEDTKYYQLLSEPCYPSTSRIISNFINTMKERGEISAALAKNLLPPDNPRPRLFYTLPKIHKSTDKWPLKIIPPGRPIVSDINSESYNVAKYIDFHLKPLARRIPSFVRDSDHVIAMLSNKCFSDNCILFTIDIDSLYTNIPIDLGLASIRRIFDMYPNSNIPSNSILKLLEINLRRNDFCFDGNFYLQICGTSMGKSFGPNYASLFLYFWESDFINDFPLKPAMWVRYIDDIMGVWPHGIESFQNFIEQLNKFYDCLNITHSYSFHDIDFLDVKIFKHDEFDKTHKLLTMIHFKETFTGHLLHSKSIHSKHFKMSIIKSQFYRILRKCSFKIHFDVAVSKISSVLISQGYNKRLIRNLKYEVLANSGFFICKQICLGFYICNHCNLCSKGLPSCFAFDNSYQQFRILSFITCDTSNVIFSIYCSLCGPISVQYSKPPLSKTALEIFSKIVSKPLDPISSHFYLQNHSHNNFYVQGLQSVNKHHPDYYPSKEILRWVKRLNTSSTDTSIFYPKTFRYMVPYSKSNSTHSFKIRQMLSNRFNVSIHSGFSSFPNLKKLLCKSKY